MPDKKALVQQFYQTADRTRVKLESREFGLAQIERFTALAEIDYAEYRGGLFAYRLSHMRGGLFDSLLDEHLAGKCGLCCYFDAARNSVFAFNIDCDLKESRESKIFTLLLCAALAECGVHTLVLKSGHGYHVWCRLSEPAENAELFEVMDTCVFSAVCGAVERGAGVGHLQCVCYPRKRRNDISIRLFGGVHPRTGLFSRVVTRIGAEDALLGEEESWLFFRDYLREAPIGPAEFARALEKARRKLPALEAAHIRAGNANRGVLLRIRADQKSMCGFRTAHAAGEAEP